MSVIVTEKKEALNLNESKLSSEGDTAWKSILDPYFPNLIEFFYPHLHSKIDWSRGYQFMDKELQRILRGDSIGGGAVDKLIQVHSCEGKDAIVLLHLEVQNQQQTHFPERLFEYYCRLYLRYKRPILVLAILTDDSRQWRPKKYQSVVWEQPVIDFYFYPNKLLDYRGRELILEESKNPFAWVVLVQLAAIKTKHNPNNRLQQKSALTRYLFKRGYDQVGVNTLLTFMDWVLVLPEALELQYNEEIKRFEEEHAMTYVTSFERHGIKLGMQQGMQQGMHNILQRQLQYKFNHIPSQYLAKLQKADSEELLKWTKTILEAKTIEEVFSE